MLLSECLRRVQQIVKADKLYIDSVNIKHYSDSGARDANNESVPPWSPAAFRWTLEGALKRELPDRCVPEIVSRLVAKDETKRQHEGEHGGGGSIDRIARRPTEEILTLLREMITDLVFIERLAAEADRYGLCLVKGQALDGSDWFDDRFGGDEDTE